MDININMKSLFSVITNTCTIVYTINRIYKVIKLKVLAHLCDLLTELPNFTQNIVFEIK